MKNFKKIIAGLFLVFAVISAGFLLYSYNNFRIKENFVSLPLNFDPVSCTSRYDSDQTSVNIKGGFVKGLQQDTSPRLILRCLSPVPEISLGNTSSKPVKLSLQLENINPVSTKIQGLENYEKKIIDPHTILLSLDVEAGTVKSFNLAPEDKKEYFEFVILGDNRNGYQTFSNIIEHINAINPVFTIDNGDLVFGGEPNKYRLFYETASKLMTPLFTTLGNHDIREGGRPVYTRLFGPAYYSFDYRNAHFVFLDSSRGWSQKQAISPEQYRWLENDLKNTKAGRIYVVSHIPPTDPRTYKDPNLFPDIPGIEKKSYFERIMDNYNQYKSLNHGFPDRQEARRFEEIMTRYRVDTVFLSHIHSYFSFISGNVRYIISGGAGAELLTPDSYYHFMRIKVSENQTYFETIGLPSPANDIQDRYVAAGWMFARAIFKEYSSIVVLAGGVLSALILIFLWYGRKRWLTFFRLTGILVSETAKFARAKRHEMLKK